MSGQAESDNSRILGHSLRKSKDVQFDEAALRAPLFSPEKSMACQMMMKLMSLFLIQVLLKGPDYSSLLLHLLMDHGSNKFLLNLRSILPFNAITGATLVISKDFFCIWCLMPVQFQIDTTWARKTSLRTYLVGCNTYFGPCLSNVSSVEPFHSREDVYK